MQGHHMKEISVKIIRAGILRYMRWLESIFYVRNICAHYGRLYNAKLSKMPVLYKEYTKI